MEPITVCGLVIVMFGLWVEFEPTVKLLARKVSQSKILKGIPAWLTPAQPVHANRDYSLTIGLINRDMPLSRATRTYLRNGI
ncbi:hypothetical protein [Geobacter sp. SVR]|uniref:hypothetical protein n=1 Tax=Geobacter sp. SVR TaxID=2495594 RepID=UPI00143F03C7|nr:hypothetical protein [Geobacter sp. SVR]BCS55051.1 hypothetical protein GSVR_33590 [Geobacter sp. SVR]GCF85233.1 hypothetical protein GSbR_18330 [Geobacter sp. SVR]